MMTIDKVAELKCLWKKIGNHNLNLISKKHHKGFITSSLWNIKVVQKKIKSKKGPLSSTNHSKAS